MPGFIELPALIISSLATTTLAANALYLGTYALAYAGLAFGAQALSNLFVKKPDIPRAEDGKYNLKQSVPSLAFVLGRARKGGDYAALEESDGSAYHVIVHAGHRINRYVRHYLHDEVATLDGSGRVIAPSHFVYKGDTFVVIDWRLGHDVETAYGDMVARMPSIWTNDHRGDGLATVRMSCTTAVDKIFLQVYPNQMPQHSAEIEGALLYDPRNPAHNPADHNTWTYSENIALQRLWHLCHPVGGKRSFADLYMPDWINAANVCDQAVINRTGGIEPRYHGGFWFRAENNPVDVARQMDQAAELVVYERPDGLIGVHAGEMVLPDIRLTAADIVSFNFDANKSEATNVLAVRGRWTDPATEYNTVDAATYGDPYVNDSERTRTIENQVVQRHNHMARMEKLAYIRANAPRVSITAHYRAAKKIGTRRFVRVHYPPKAVEAIVEVTSSPKLSLRRMEVEFSGIIVPDTLFDFVAATEEGAPGANVIPLPPAGVPMPQGFTVDIQTEVVSGGATAAYAVANWDHFSDSLLYEFEWQKSSEAEAPQSVLSDVSEDHVRSNYLSDGVQYRFRLRAWSNGAASEWTDYEILTAVADPTPPSVVAGAAATGGSGTASYSWTAPNSPNYGGVRLYINTVNSFVGATLLGTEYGPPNIPDGRVISGVSAGTKYGFIVAINTSGKPAADVATGPFTVT